MKIVAGNHTGAGAKVRNLLTSFFLAELGTSEACFLNLNLFINTNFKDGREDHILLRTKLPQYWGNFVHFFNLD